MSSDIFTVIEAALIAAGYEVKDGDRDSVIIGHPNSDADYIIRVSEIEE